LIGGIVSGDIEHLELFESSAQALIWPTGPLIPAVRPAVTAIWLMN